MKTGIRLLGRLLLSLPFLSIASIAPAAVYLDEFGWTQIEPSPDSIIVYVSSSEGLDSNDGLSPETPKKTISAANSLLRINQPDHMLLKRGDVFPAETSMLGRWKSGRSADEPMVLSAYGDGPRPIIEINDRRFIDHDGDSRSYFALIGLDLYKSNSDINSDKFANVGSLVGLRFVGGGRNILVEDCRFRFVEIVVQSFGEANGLPQVYRDFKFRRNIVVDNWSHGSGTGGPSAQGMFFAGVDGYLLEENVFDHNGFHPTIAGAEANMFNHNVYIQYSNKAGGIMRGNVYARGAAHGMQARSGGTVERNLFVANAVSVNFGGVAPPTDVNVFNFDNKAYQNVIIEGRLMHPTNNEYPRTEAVWALPITFIQDVDIIDNIIANRRDSGSNQAFLEADGGTFNLIDNIVYQWDSRYDTTNPSWLDPERDLGDYMQSLGKGSSTDDYYTALRERPPGEYPWELSTYAAISYIREGFNKDPVGGYYKYAGQPNVPVTGVSATLDSLTLSPGQTTSVTAYVEPANASNAFIHWSSTNTSVVEVDGFGQVIARSAGTAQLVATSADGGFTDTISVTVSGADIPVVSVETSIPLLSLNVFATRQITAEVHPYNASKPTLTWSSSNTDVLTVDQTGLVTAKAPGSAVVTVTSVNGRSDSLGVTVRETAAPWGGYPRDSGGNVDTGEFLGWILVDGDWIWMWDTLKYAYLPESFLTPTGAWTYILRD